MCNLYLLIYENFISSTLDTRDFPCQYPDKENEREAPSLPSGPLTQIMAYSKFKLCLNRVIIKLQLISSAVYSSIYNILSYYKYVMITHIHILT